MISIWNWGRHPKVVYTSTMHFCTIIQDFLTSLGKINFWLRKSIPIMEKMVYLEIRQVNIFNELSRAQIWNLEGHQPLGASWPIFCWNGAAQITGAAQIRPWHCANRVFYSAFFHCTAQSGGWHYANSWHYTNAEFPPELQENLPKISKTPPSHLQSLQKSKKW